MAAKVTHILGRQRPSSKYGEGMRTHNGRSIRHMRGAWIGLGADSPAGPMSGRNLHLLKHQNNYFSLNIEGQSRPGSLS